MAERNEQADANAWPVALRKLQREVESLRRALSRAEERADAVVQHLVALEQAAAQCELQAPVGELSPPPRRSPSESTFLLKLAAESGVQSLEIERQDSGEAAVRVDAGKVFRLSLTLASLLAVLAADNARGDGILVGWKSLPEVMAKMQRQLGRPFTPHAIHQLVSRLRSALAVLGGANPFLVQTHPHHGLRFALRRPPPATSSK